MCGSNWRKLDTRSILFLVQRFALLDPRRRLPERWRRGPLTTAGRRCSRWGRRWIDGTRPKKVDPGATVHSAMPTTIRHQPDPRSAARPDARHRRPAPRTDIRDAHRATARSVAGMAIQNQDALTGAATALLNQIAQLAPMFTTPGEIRDLAQAFALVAGADAMKPAGLHSV